MEGDPHWLLRAALDNWGARAQAREKCVLKEISLLETAKLLRKLGNSSACGHDKLDTISLKIVATHLLKPFNFLINISIKTGKFANQWKIGKLLSLHKGKGLDKTSPNNYRPIAILPVTSKIIERAVQEQLVSFMTRSGQLNFNHHAYLQSHSTTTTLLQMLDQLYEAADDRLISTLMTLDESNAFESVNHTLLTQKMQLYNFDNTTINWFKNYLSYRSSYVSINVCNWINSYWRMRI